MLSIAPENVVNRFCVDGGTDYTSYILAYLVEEPEKLKWTDLEIGDVITNGIKRAMVTAIDSTDDNLHIYASEWLSNKQLRDWEKIEK